ncbi:MAG: glutathione synthetase ATP-binding domain-like protein [Monoraphidium minutum]|nr:MAG: glutathione synthetase ATP-binding domain-like protein [Monoraphidium minutum]
MASLQAFGSGRLAAERASRRSMARAPCALPGKAVAHGAAAGLVRRQQQQPLQQQARQQQQQQQRPRHARAVAPLAAAAVSSPGVEAKRPRLDQAPGVDQELLRAATPAGQAAREGLLKGAVVLFVCAGYSKKRFIYEKARALGVTAILVDSPNHWGRDAVGSAFDGFHPVDLSKDTDAVLDDISDIYRRVTEEHGAVHGIVSFSDLAQPLVARLCERLGYPANSVAAVATARNKDLTRHALAEAGLPTPGHAMVRGPEDLKPAAAAVGFPSVLKPVGGSESIGVVRVDSVEDMMGRYSELQAILRATAYKDGNLSTFDDESDAEGNANAALEFFTDLMLEEYMDGAEVDCDIVLSDGKVMYANVVDNGPTHEPWFQETNTNSPSLLTQQQQAELIECATQSLAAMGLVHGVQHTELKYTSRGARLLEVNPRMGGRGVHTINKLSTGVCMITEQLLASCGLPCAPPRPAAPLACIAEYGIVAPRSGVLADHSFVEKWASHPDVVYCRALADVGAKLTGLTDGFPSWIADVMVRKATPEEAVAFVKSVHDDINACVKITPLPGARSEE